MSGRHVVMYSGGITSWATARRVVEMHGSRAVTLLFADTLIEDPDLYRFLRESSASLGAELVWLKEGRTPFEVFRDVRWIGNTRVAPCSRVLKQEPCRRWIKENRDPSDTTLHVGIDWTETHRLPAIRRGYEPWRVEAPLSQPPYVDKRDLLALCRSSGVEPCSQYREGVSHANCGGGCVRGGQASWAHLLRTHPDRYARWEREESALRDELGQGAILRDRTGGELKPLPLVEFRRRVETGEADQFELNFDWGGCGCFPSSDVAS